MHIDGKKVVDARAGMVLTITKRDCVNGNNRDPGSCAAARALLREVPRCTKARVHLGRIYVEVGERWLRFQTPGSIRSEIIAFDRGAEFSPGEYRLNPLCPSNREGARAKRAKSPSKRKTPRVARIRYHKVSGVRHHLVK
jgi:hypothetical protein